MVGDQTEYNGDHRGLATYKTNTATPSLQPTPEQTKFNVATSREFKPQNYEVRDIDNSRPPESADY